MGFVPHLWLETSYSTFFGLSVLVAKNCRYKISGGCLLKKGLPFLVDESSQKMR